MMLAAVATFAAEDPGGWSKAKWGMSDEEILAALPGQAVRLDPPEKYLGSRVHIPSFELAGSEFEVHFVPDKAGRLSSVLLSPVGTPSEGFDYLFQSLENLLVAKYGRPWKSTEARSERIQWSLKTTTITLSRSKFPGFDIQILNLQYKVRPADLDKL
jgi:hypothetical protein